MLRYTLLRLLIFFGVLFALYLVPFFRQDKFLLVLVAAVVSAGISFFLLSQMRDEWTADWMARREAKAAAREAAGVQGSVRGLDESAEDAESAGSAESAEDNRR